MADIEIVRESAEGYTHQGHSVSYTETYLKVRRSFRQHALKTLKGAPLSVFWDIALADKPLTVEQLCEDTAYTSPTTVCAALDFLVDRHFIEEVGKVGSNGAKLYRAIGYTWSGSDRNAPQDVVEQPVQIPKNGIRNPTPKSGIRRSKTGIRAPKTGIRPPLMNDMNESNHLHEKTFIHDTRPLLEKAGVKGKNLDLLAAVVSSETAALWADWVAGLDRSKWKQPGGYVWKQLSVNPNARPPIAAESPEPAPRKFQISGHLANRREEE